MNINIIKGRIAEIVAIGFIMFAMIFGLLMFATKARANPSRIQEPVSCSTQGTSATSLSTSTLSYMTPGTGTTTITCNVATAGQGTQVFDSAKLAIQLTASSTGTSLCRRYRYSQDGIDYYPLSIATNSAATTTSEIGTYYESCFSFASSTAELGGTVTRNLKIVDLPIYAQYVKVDFYIPMATTSNVANGAVWANVIGKTEKTE